jgi:hypothetical protein
MDTFSSQISSFSLVNGTANVDLTTHLICDQADNDGQFGPNGAFSFHSIYYAW